jgi:hypothetical protein
MASKDFAVTCADDPDWRVSDLTAREAKHAADEHDDAEHDGRSIAQTEKMRPSEKASGR